MQGLRFRFIFGFLALVWAILLLRIFILTIKTNDYFEQLALRNMTKKEILVPTRGLILDRNHQLLAMNELGFSISLAPALKKSQLQQELEFLARHFPALDTQAAAQNYRHQNSVYNHNAIQILDFIPYEEMQTLYPKLILDPKISISPANKRHYPGNALASHVIGYLGAADMKDMQSDPKSQYTHTTGKTGLEKQYNDFLQGEMGYKLVSVNALNQELKVLEEKQPKTNNDLVLTLDKRLQEKADALFVGKVGAVVVMDAHTGAILAAGSYPEYNLNNFIGGISVAHWKELQDNIYNPLLNRLVNGLYPPGSVVKMGSALSFLEYLPITEQTEVFAPGYIEVGKRKFRDWKAGGHGRTNLYKAIKESVDVYFYKFALDISIDNLAKTFHQMGFGQKTGVDLPNEFAGILPDPGWKMKRFGDIWNTGDTLITSIGQGSFLTTPLQVANYTALIASGKLPTPHFALKGNFKVKDVLDNFQKSKLPALRQGMYEACSTQGGTGYSSTRGVKVALACKTGTAQVVGIDQDTIKRIKEDQMEYFHRSHAWMTAFLPYKNPKYVITVLVEHGEGGSKNGPIVKAIANALVDLGYLKP
ncbi:Penicillin-binding protein 2 [Helicobacter heilmannii]|uniref:penicillin-binding protein 2 n=1 Tax=Helicobacter heilmannii TaxID=35817 RepID=UPI00244D9707|nr:penicillin-binding protein 2 [Helicobacter heilmannii]GMB95253.1 Penicillin-binding protein 2 [Helicobacter heilmannii]